MNRFFSILGSIAVATVLLGASPTSPSGYRVAVDSGTVMIIKDTTTNRTIILPKLTKSSQFAVGDSTMKAGAKSWVDDHYATIMRIWTESEDCKVLGLQDEIGEYQRNLGLARARSVLMYLTKKQYPDSEVAMTGFTPSSLVLANDAKTRLGLSKLHGLMNQRAFMLVCEKKATTMAKVKQFVRAKLEEIREQVKENESAIAVLENQIRWLWVLGILGAIALIIALWNFWQRVFGRSQERANPNHDQPELEPGQGAVPPPEGPNEPDEGQDAQRAGVVAGFGQQGRRDIDLFDPDHRDDGLMASISVYAGENEDEDE